MSDFVRYSKKNRGKNNVCTQNVVYTKDALLKIRLTPKLKDRIMGIAGEKGKSASELTRLLWEDYFKKVDDKAWAAEVAGWN